MYHPIWLGQKDSDQSNGAGRLIHSRSGYITITTLCSYGKGYNFFFPFNRLGMFMGHICMCIYDFKNNNYDENCNTLCINLSICDSVAYCALLYISYPCTSVIVISSSRSNLTAKHPYETTYGTNTRSRLCVCVCMCVQLLTIFLWSVSASSETRRL